MAQIKMLREAEVTHGRVAMTAVIGFLVQESGFHPLFNLADKSIGPAILHLGEVRTQAPVGRGVGSTAFLDARRGGA